MADGEHVVVRNPRGGWLVTDLSGKVRTSRHRLKHAQDAAERINLGLKPVSEARQVLAEWPLLFFRRKSFKSTPFVIADANGVIIRRFGEEWRAKWWLREYLKRRELRSSAMFHEEGDKELLDWITRRWKLSDELLDYDKRVQEITRLLKAGRG